MSICKIERKKGRRKGFLFGFTAAACLSAHRPPPPLLAASCVRDTHLLRGGNWEQLLSSPRCFARVRLIVKSRIGRRLHPFLSLSSTSDELGQPVKLAAATQPPHNSLHP